MEFGNEAKTIMNPLLKNILLRAKRFDRKLYKILFRLTRSLSQTLYRVLYPKNNKELRMVTVRRARALLIGISEYGEGFNPLPQAISDVKALRRVLLDPDLGSFSRDNVTILENPTCKEMETGISKFFSEGKRGKEDFAFFYFSGHGWKDKNASEFYLVSSDSSIEEGNFISSTFLAKKSRESHADRKVLVFDCCFSGALQDTLIAKGKGPFEPIVREDIKDKLSGEGVALLTSCDKDEYSYILPEFDLSIYTHYLIKGIENGAADIDGNGFITAGELHKYATTELSKILPKQTSQKQASQEETSKKQTSQTPTINSKDKGKKIILAGTKETFRTKTKKIFRDKVKDLLKRKPQTPSPSLEPLDEKLIEIWRDKFDLTNEEAKRILEEELNPPPEQYKFRKYREAVKIALKQVKQEEIPFKEGITFKEGIPFSGQLRETLDEIKHYLNLSDAEAHKIEQEEFRERPIPTPPDPVVFAVDPSITEVAAHSPKRVLSLAITPDNQTIVSSSADGTIKLWSLEGKLIDTLSGHEGWVRSLAISPDGETLVSGSSDETIRLWNLSERKLRRTIPIPSHGVYSVVMTSDDKIISGGSDGKIWVSNLNTDPNTEQCVSIIQSQEKILALAITSNGKRLISGGEEGTIRQLDMSTFKELSRTSLGKIKILSVAISPRKLVFASGSGGSGSSDNTIKLWDMASGEMKSPLLNLTDYSGGVYAVAFTSSGQTIIGGSKDKTIKLWDANDGKLIRPPLKKHSSAVLCLAISSDSRTIVSGSNDGRVKIWKFSSV